MARALAELKKRLHQRWLDENRPDLEDMKDPRVESLEQDRMQEKYGSEYIKSLIAQQPKRPPQDYSLLKQEDLIGVPGFNTREKRQAFIDWAKRKKAKRNMSAESFKPPQSAVNNAKRGLELRKKWGRGGLSPSEAKSQGIDSGVTRARKIASGKVSTHDVRRMSAFNRHRKNYRPEKKMSDGGPTAGTIAWLLWGGTSGVNWAKKKSAAMNAEEVSMTDWENWEGDLPERYPNRQPRPGSRRGGTMPIKGPDFAAYNKEKRKRKKESSPTLTVVKVESVGGTRSPMDQVTFENGLVAAYPTSKNAKVGDRFVVATFDGMFPKIMDAEYFEADSYVPDRKDLAKMGVGLSREQKRELFLDMVWERLGWGWDLYFVEYAPDYADTRDYTPVRAVVIDNEWYDQFSNDEEMYEAFEALLNDGKFEHKYGVWDRTIKNTINEHMIDNYIWGELYSEDYDYRESMYNRIEEIERMGKDAEDYGVGGVWMSEDSYDEVRELGCPICSHSLKTVSASAECPMCEVLWHYHQDDGFSYFEAEGDFGDEFAVEFDDWADQEMMTHGKDVSFQEWADEEGEKHGDMNLVDWAKDEEKSHDKRYEAEEFCAECGCSHGEVSEEFGAEEFGAETSSGTQVFNSCWKCGSGLHLYQIIRYPATPGQIAGVGGDPSEAKVKDKEE